MEIKIDITSWDTEYMGEESNLKNKQQAIMDAPKPDRCQNCGRRRFQRTDDGRWYCWFCREIQEVQP